LSSANLLNNKLQIIITKEDLNEWISTEGNDKVDEENTKDNNENMFK